MNAPLYQNPWNFMGLQEEHSSPGRARAWVLPAPHEGTTSYGAGTRDGPTAILAASRPIERFDSEFGNEPALVYGIHTLSALAPVRQSPDSMVEAVEAAVSAILSGRPRPEVLGILGGEHSLSAGAVRAVRRIVPGGSLVAVQIDAHGDLRDEYEGSRHSHGCAARRILDECPLFQIGIRSLCAEEDAFRRGRADLVTVFSEAAADPAGAFLDDLARFVRGKNVYLTVDLDGLDPSIMPSVGTPEPGGIGWERLLDIARVIAREAARVPVFDVVELAPIPVLRAPDFLAAKLVYKLFSLVLLGRRGGQAVRPGAAARP